VLVGGRLGHCLLYEPDFYLGHPLEILNLSRGGVSSHGATVGILLCCILYARHYRYSMTEISDRMSFSVMFGASLVRIGNFFNSEIVGREWHGAWAVKFPRFSERVQAGWERLNGPLEWAAQPLPRHPVQLYEALGILGVLAVLLLIDRSLGERRPRGLLAGVFCGLYFIVRFNVEFVKEYLRFADVVPDPAEQVIRMLPTSGLTMGQFLSIPFIVMGIALAAWALHARLPAAQLSTYDDED
ncbi:MAG: prolipoprotein diacylglyceryl transferase, partial [Planctomycetota bacterium]